MAERTGRPSYRLSRPRRGDTGHDIVAGYHDPRLGKRVSNIVVGGCLVSRDPDVVISTTLGSCIAVCLFDPLVGVGGMNHFLLAASANDRLSASARYGAAAMEQLVNRVLSYTGRRDHLRAKVFGGGSVINTNSDVGQRNIEFVMEYLANEGIPTMGWDVGGTQARAVRFFPTTGRTQRRLLGQERTRELASSEASFLDSLMRTPIEGEIELF